MIAKRSREGVPGVHSPQISFDAMRTTWRTVTLSSLLLVALAAPASAAGGVDLQPVGTFVGADAEIVTFDPTTDRMFVSKAQVNGIDVIDISNPATPALVTSVSMAPYGASVTSVAARPGLVAVAVAAASHTDPGQVVLVNPATATVLAAVPVGVLPDSLAFTPDGGKIVVANEAEPRCVGTTYSDPTGSISVITVPADPATATAANVATAGFAAFESQEAALEAAGARFFGPGSTLSQDAEPEFVSIAPDSTTAYVTMQENNAIAVVDLATATVTAIQPLGYKDHSIAGFGFDPSDRDGSGTTPAIKIDTWPVKGMYQPDAISVFDQGATRYTISANEGDARDYPGCFSEETRIGSQTFTGPITAIDRDGDTTVARTDDDELSRLRSTSAFPFVSGGVDAYSFGARSFTVRNATTGAVVFDSGDQIEQIVKTQNPTYFNTNFSSGAFELDTRSDDKGPEPEGLVTGSAFGKRFAFVLLERANGVMTFDITDPTAPVFEEWENSKTNYAAGTGDISPEGAFFIPAADSPTGEPLLLVANELSFTTTIYRLANTSGPEPVIPEVPVALMLPLAALAAAVLVLGRRSRLARLS